MFRYPGSLPGVVRSLFSPDLLCRVPDLNKISYKGCGESLKTRKQRFQVNDITMYVLGSISQFREGKQAGKTIPMAVLPVMGHAVAGSIGTVTIFSFPFPLVFS